MSASDQTANDMFGSLTGFDEIAIRKEFRSDIYTLGDEDRAGFLRALIFVHRRREGDKDTVAYKAAMELPQSAASDYFADEDDEADDDLGEG